ncbi:MAG TPA: hypothetical protein VHM30_03530 [Gemmatimonadaceae bacterium]|nr:hypothetical protein [Gemmatimonadaceae bacterium]
MIMRVEFYKGGGGRLGHHLAWQRNEPTPLRATLDAMYARWLALAEGTPLALEWPVRPLPGPAPRRHPPRAARTGRPRSGIV